MESQKGTDGDSSWFIQLLQIVEDRERNQVWPLLPNNLSSVRVPMKKCNAKGSNETGSAEKTVDRSGPVPQDLRTDLMEPEGKESSDAIMEEVIRSEPLVSFTRDGDSSWFIQLLRNLEEQEQNQPWPLLPNNYSSMCVSTQNCDKCRQEYISSINYRRHRCDSKSRGEASTTDWEPLGNFWDQLSSEDAKEVVSFNNISLEEVAGSSIVKALSDLVRKNRFSHLPHIYMKAGSEILDIIQGKASRFPISSDELFSLLDYASERTFLRGSVFPIKNHIFDGSPGKTGLERKNLVALSSFLLERRLIDAWQADKDAEILRINERLLDEKEAARKRRPEVVEKRRDDTERCYVTVEGKENVNQNIMVPNVKDLEDKDVTTKTITNTSDSVNKTFDDASETMVVVKDIVVIDSAEMTDVNGAGSGEKIGVSKTNDNYLAEKADFNGSDVKGTNDTGTAEKTDFNKASHKKASHTSSSWFIHLLRALEEQEKNQAWPLLPNSLSSVNVPMQKCDKCSQKYISAINYRRHNCDSKNPDQASATQRNWLGIFWDKLSTEDAKEVVSFKNIYLEEVAGSSIVKALSDLVRKPGFLPLPIFYMKAGSEILDIIQGKTSRFPISSDELFALLDYASERTSLRGSVASLKTIFDGNPGKTGLERNNLVACSSFLLERSLIDAWRVDMKAAKLSCNKKALEEREADRKRHIELVEKGRRDSGGSDVTCEEKENVNRNITIPIAKASVEKAVMWEIIANASPPRVDVSETNDNNSVEKEIFNGFEVKGTNETGSVEKIDVDKAHKKPVDMPSPQTDSADVAKTYTKENNETHSASKSDVTETNDNNSVEKSAFNGPKVKGTNDTGSVEKTDVDKASNKKPVDTPSHETDSADLANVDKNYGQIERGHSLIEEGVFVRKQQHRRKRDVIPTVSDSARATSTGKPAVGPPGNYSARGTPAEKASNNCGHYTPSSKPPAIPSSNNTAWGNPKLNPGVLPAVNFSPRGTPSSSNVYRGLPPGVLPVNFSPRGTISCSYVYGGLPSSKHAVSQPVAACVYRPASKPVTLPPSSHSAQATQARKPVDPSPTGCSAQATQASKPLDPSPRSYSARTAQASKPVFVTPTSYLANFPSLESSVSAAPSSVQRTEHVKVLMRFPKTKQKSKHRSKSRVDEPAKAETSDEPALVGESSRSEARNKETTDEPVLERESSQAEARNGEAADESTEQNETADHRGAVPRGNLLENRDRDSAIGMAEDFLRQRWREAYAERHITVVVTDVPCNPRNTRYQRN